MGSHEILMTEGSGNSHLQRLGNRKRSKSRGDLKVPIRDVDLDPVVFSAASESGVV